MIELVTEEIKLLNAHRAQAGMRRPSKNESGLLLDPPCGMHTQVRDRGRLLKMLALEFWLKDGLIQHLLIPNL